MIIPMGQKLEQRPSELEGQTVEVERVRRWRREQFHELGFTLTEAYELADAPVDLGVARRIIAAGCPRETAIRILL